MGITLLMIWLPARIGFYRDPARHGRVPVLVTTYGEHRARALLEGSAADAGTTEGEQGVMHEDPVLRQREGLILNAVPLRAQNRDTTKVSFPRTASCSSPAGSE
jgi:hypothetical protein